MRNSEICRLDDSITERGILPLRFTFICLRWENPSVFCMSHRANSAPQRQCLANDSLAFTRHAVHSPVTPLPYTLCLEIPTGDRTTEKESRVC